LAKLVSQRHSRAPWQTAEKLFSEGVILSEAKDLLSARAESKADPSDALNRRDLRMTLM
jgi:hypothetical protein